MVVGVSLMPLSFVVLRRPLSSFVVLRHHPSSSSLSLSSSLCYDVVVAVFVVSLVRVAFQAGTTKGRRRACGDETHTMLK